MTEWLNKFNLLPAYMLIISSFLTVVSAPWLFYIQQFEKEYPDLSGKEHNWLVWPAIAANYFFEFLFGKRGNKFRDLFTWRSLSVTLLISLSANLLCVYLILTSIPQDLPCFNLQLMRILGLSYFIFIMFNFLGDLISVSITRHVLSKIIAGKCNFVRYICMDTLGILLGYLITISPTITIIAFGWFTGHGINQWIHNGFMGSVLIPFFLFIFATTKMPFPFLIFASIAVFSIFIPTFIYILFMGVCFFGYRIYRPFIKNKRPSLTEFILKFLIITSIALAFLAPILEALKVIIRAKLR